MKNCIHHNLFPCHTFCLFIAIDFINSPSLERSASSFGGKETSLNILINVFLQVLCDHHRNRFLMTSKIDLGGWKDSTVYRTLAIHGANLCLTPVPVMVPLVCQE